MSLLEGQEDTEENIMEENFIIMTIGIINPILPLDPYR